MTKNTPKQGDNTGLPERNYTTSIQIPGASFLPSNGANNTWVVPGLYGGAIIGGTGTPQGGVGVIAPVVINPGLRITSLAAYFKSESNRPVSFDLVFRKTELRNAGTVAGTKEFARLTAPAADGVRVVHGEPTEEVVIEEGFTYHASANLPITQGILAVIVYAR